MARSMDKVVSLHIKMETYTKENGLIMIKNKLIKQLDMVLDVLLILKMEKLKKENSEMIIYMNQNPKVL